MLHSIYAKIAGGLAGTALLYIAAFLYEDDERRIENRLQEFWVRVDDLAKQSLSKHAAFLQEISRFTDGVFDRIFGHELLSFRALSVSSGFSAGSFLISIPLFFPEVLSPFHFWLSRLVLFVFVLAAFCGGYLYGKKWDDLVNVGEWRVMLVLLVFLWLLGVALWSVLRLRPGPGLWICGVLVLWAGGILVLVRHWEVKRGELLEWAALALVLGLGFALGLVLAVMLVPVVMLGPVVMLMLAMGLVLKTPIYASIGLAGPIAVSFMCDVLFVFLLRRSLRWCSRLDSTLKIGAVILFNLALGALLVGLPLEAKHLAAWEGKIGKALAGLNIWDAAVSLLVVVLAGAALAHKWLWPFISRPLYALATRTHARRKLLGAIGFGLLLYAMGALPDLLKKMVESFL
jgi:hypothetical protein